MAGKKKEAAEPSNRIADDALAAVQAIQEDAKKKMLEQLDGLKNAKKNIQARIKELEEQVEMIDGTIAKITGKAPAAGGGEPRTRMNLNEVRERIGNWIMAHKGTMYSSSDLQKEFPEIEGMSVSPILKPLINEGKIRTEGQLRGLRYMA